MLISLDIDLNTTDRTAGRIEYEAKEFLKANGFTVLASGDGLSAYSSSGDIITASGSGANGMNNARAWYRIQSPEGYEWIRQITSVTGDPDLRVKFSLADGFTGGSGSADTTPTATDEELELGGGTDASPTGQNGAYPNISSGIRRILGCIDNSDPYGFWIVCLDDYNQSDPNFVWMHDKVVPVADHQLPPSSTGDTELFVNYYNASTTAEGFRRVDMTDKDPSNACARWSYFGGSHGNCCISCTNNDWTDQPVNPENGNPDIGTNIWYREATQGGTTGIKGFSRFIYSYLPTDGGIDTHRETYNCLGKNNLFIRMDDCVLLWDGSAVATDLASNTWDSVDANFAQRVISLANV